MKTNLLFGVAVVMLLANGSADCSPALSVCDAPPPDRGALFECALESGKEWVERKPASRDIADLALEAAATDDAAKLRGIVADLVGFIVYRSQHQPSP